MSFGPEWFIVIGALLLLFGGTQIPKLARSLGEAKKEFEKGSTEDKKATTAKTSDDDA